MTELPGWRYPELINDDEKLLVNSFVVPDAALADVPAALRGPAEPNRPAARRGRPGTGVGRVFRRGWRQQHDRDRRKPHRPGKAPALGLRASRLAPSLSRGPHPKRR